MDHVHWAFFTLHLQILLHPLGRRQVVLLLEGGVEDGLALEAGALRDALNGDGQVSTFTQLGDGMSHAQFISVGREGGIQILIEAAGDPDTGDIECMRNVMQGEVEIDVWLFGFNIGHDALQIGRFFEGIFFGDGRIGSDYLLPCSPKII